MWRHLARRPTVPPGIRQVRHSPDAGPVTHASAARSKRLIFRWRFVGLARHGRLDLLGAVLDRFADGLGTVGDRVTCFLRVIADRIPGGSGLVGDLMSDGAGAVRYGVPDRPGVFLDDRLGVG